MGESETFDFVTTYVGITRPKKIECVFKTKKKNENKNYIHILDNDTEHTNIYIIYLGGIQLCLCFALCKSLLIFIIS